jgi:hypothetical protein
MNFRFCMPAFQPLVVYSASAVWSVYMSMVNHRAAFGDPTKRSVAAHAAPGPAAQHEPGG